MAPCSVNKPNRWQCDSVRYLLKYHQRMSVVRLLGDTLNIQKIVVYDTN